MNVTMALEENNKRVHQTQSPQTIDSDGSGDENPLMKLVDAAASLIAKKKGSVGSKIIIEKDDTISSPRSCADDIDKATTDTMLCKDQEETVILGTKEDLIRRSEKKTTFAEYLMQVLDDESNCDILTWMPDGVSFTILDHRKFTMDRMPKLFKIRNMSSFVRKLTRWGFHRVHLKETGNSDIFKHEYFVRGKPELAKKIRCLNRAAELAAAASEKKSNNTTNPSKSKGSLNKTSHAVKATVTPPPRQLLDRIGQNQGGHPSSGLRTMPSANIPISKGIGNQYSQLHQGSERTLRQVSERSSIHGSERSSYRPNEREQFLVRQEQLRKQAMARQEEDLKRQHHELLQQKLNRISPEFQKGLLARAEAEKKASYLNDPLLQRSGSLQPSYYHGQPRMTPQEIMRQQHQLQQQQRRLEQQQRALEIARLQHEQEQKLKVPFRRQNSVTDYEMELDDLMGASNRSLDFLGASNRSIDFLNSSTRSIDLLGSSARGIDFLNASNRSMDLLGPSGRNFVGGGPSMGDIQASLIREGPHGGAPPSPPRAKHQRERFATQESGRQPSHPLQNRGPLPLNDSLLAPTREEMVRTMLRRKQQQEDQQGHFKSNHGPISHQHQHLERVNGSGFSPNAAAVNGKVQLNAQNGMAPAARF